MVNYLNKSIICHLVACNFFFFSIAAFNCLSISAVDWFFDNLSFFFFFKSEINAFNPNIWISFFALPADFDLVGVADFFLSENFFFYGVADSFNISRWWFFNLLLFIFLTAS